MGRIIAFLYGLVCYAAFFATFLYLIGFVGGFGVPTTTLNATAEGGVVTALVVDVLLVALFGVQHSVMARPAFKRRWTRLVPRPVERSTFVLVTSAVLWLMFWQWRPLPGVLWDVTGSPVTSGVIWGLFALGWAIVLLSTVLINHFDLFGLRQVWLYLRGRGYQPVGFRMPLLYRLVRHPLMLGFIIAFWATPLMTTGHLVFAAAFTVYILIAIRIEERDLVHFLGDDYRRYREAVPALVPLAKRTSMVHRTGSD